MHNANAANNQRVDYLIGAQDGGGPSQKLYDGPTVAKSDDDRSACRSEVPKSMRDDMDATGQSVILDARRLRFCVEHRAWPHTTEHSFNASMGCLGEPKYWMTVSTDDATHTFTSPDPIKCIDLAMRSVGK